MVPALSDRGLKPSLDFKQAENWVSYTQSSQKRYDDKVCASLHGLSKESKIYSGIEVETLVSIFMLPDRYTEESIELKKVIHENN